VEDNRWKIGHRMTSSSLADLDELVLKCRDDRARSYIVEAVSCYHAAAYRSAIVATWIAVCYDIIDKLRELTLAGDKAAELVVKRIDAACVANDFSQALKLERELIELARNQFELISHLEYIDLARIREDRNRCAHPSLVSDEANIAPSAELARLHIRAAVTHLLQHPPAQGKYALDRLMRDIGSEYFPSDADQAILALSTGPLKRPRDSLVRNFAVVLLKRLLREQSDYKEFDRTMAAFTATRKMHPQPVDFVLAEKLNPFIRDMNDVELRRATFFLNAVKDVWQFLEVDTRQKLQNYVLLLPYDNVADLEFLLDYPPLRDMASMRVARATRKELADTLWLYFQLPEKVGDRCVVLYLASESFDQANEWAKQLMWLAKQLSLSVNHQKMLIAGIRGNTQIMESFELGPLLSQLRATKKMPIEEFDGLLLANGLQLSNARVAVPRAGASETSV
jgi:hypothetical protein